MDESSEPDELGEARRTRSSASPSPDAAELEQARHGRSTDVYASPIASWTTTARAATTGQS